MPSYHLKANRADYGTKIQVINTNKYRHPISALCKVLRISRSTYYYKSKSKVADREAENAVITIFKSNRSIYGARKIKRVLAQEHRILSRRRIRRIMYKFNLVSKYTEVHYKVHSSSCNEAPIENELNRNFDGQLMHSVVVSDLTYVRVKQRWHYICILIDLFNREIIGYSAGAHKNADLVYKAFARANISLSAINMFHTDRGREFKNAEIDAMLQIFSIQRSLSRNGCPYDNAVTEVRLKP